MDISLLETTARQLTREGHGILAADDSALPKRFDGVGITGHTEETRRKYRQMLVTSDAAKNYLSGVILHEETFPQKLDNGMTFPEFLKSVGILPGIKLDQGLVDLPGFPGEKITKGLDALPDRAADYSGKGARFVKWRNVINIADGIPTDECIGANTFVLSRYARICQDNNMVPIVEPEIVMDGVHTSETCERVQARTFDILFQTLRAFRVHLPGMVIKSSMVVPGKQGDQEMEADDVAERTMRILKDHTPADLGGFVFLSGGQSTGQAIVNLNRIAKRATQELAFGVTFSYLRALQDPALKQWATDMNDDAGAQAVFEDTMKQAAAARDGKLDESAIAEHHMIGNKDVAGWEY
jgi:fructose-bisphosphate aldolase class I